MRRFGALALVIGVTLAVAGCTPGVDRASLATRGDYLVATLVGDELFAELHVTDEHLVASALEELTGRVESEGLLHRPGGLEVRVSS